LNGLKAIVYLIRVRRDDSNVLRNPNSPLAPNPLQKDEPASGLDCSGGFQSRAGYPSNGPAAGGGYVLRARPKVKIPGTIG
jgi:hypothetical protein